MGAYNTTGFQTQVTGAPLALGAAALGLTGGTLFGGPAGIEFVVTGTTVKGQFLIVTAAFTMDIADTAEMHVDGTNQRLYKLFPFPQTPFAVQFNVTAAGNATIILRAVPNY